MPIYDFRCGTCGAIRSGRAGYEESRTLALVCIECGGEMRVAPVLVVAVAHGAEDPAIEAERQARRKACGHTHHCRCHIRLDRPNPFDADIRAAMSSGTEET